MARVTLTPQVLAKNGATGITNLTWTSADATNDMEFVSDGSQVVLMKNENAATNTVVFASVADLYGRTADTTIVVAGKGAAVATIAMAGPFPRQLFNQTDGKVYINLTVDTDLSFAVVTVPRE